jgi:hypothetical protein
MHQNDLNKQILESKNSLIYGTSGTGKTTLAIEIIVKYLQGNFKYELFNKEINLLHPLVGGQVPVLFITSDFPYYVLNKIKNKIFTPEHDFNFNPLIHTYNFCKVSNYSILSNLENFIISKQCKLIVMDAYCSSPNQFEDWQKTLDIIQKHEVTLINTVSSRKKMVTSDLSFSSSHLGLLRYSNLAIETKNFSPQSINLKITKNRFGPVNLEIDYEL